MAFDLVFVGNASINEITTARGDVRVTEGGSAFGSALAAASFRALSIAVISSIGSDYPASCFALSQPNVDTSHVSRVSAPSTRFGIVEPTESVTVLSPSIVSMPCLTSGIQTRHLHVSCRAGVPALYYVDEITHNTLSFDVMASSLEQRLQEIMDLLPRATYLFCNEREFEMLVGKFGEGFWRRYSQLTISVTRGPRGAKQISLAGIVSAPGVKLSERQVVSTTGAGDAFLGAFLGAAVAGFRLLDCLSLAIAVSAVSVTDFGIDHVLQKSSEIKRCYHMVLKLIGTDALALDRMISCKYLLPRLILVVGPSGAGKSDCIRAIQRLFYLYEPRDEAEALRELFRLQELVQVYHDARTDIDRVLAIQQMERLREQANYVNEHIFRIGSSLTTGGGKPLEDPLAMPAEDGGWVITNPEVWDIAYASLFSRADLSGPLIIEFARGEAQSTLQNYERCLEAALDLTGSDPDEAFVLHISAPLGPRLQRNSARRVLGGHYVPEETMRKYYATDPLAAFADSAPGNRALVVLSDRRISFRTIDNSVDKDSFEIEEYFDQEIRKSIPRN